jgi:hypothetical protein
MNMPCPVIANHKTIYVMDQNIAHDIFGRYLQSSLLTEDLWNERIAFYYCVCTNDLHDGAQDVGPAQRHCAGT